MPRPPQTLAQRWLRALYAAKCSPAQVHIYTAYACFLAADGSIQVDRRTIAEMTGRDSRTIREHVAAAIEMGLLTVDSAPGPGQPTRYRVRLP